MRWDASDRSPDCPRLARWLSRQDTLPIKYLESPPQPDDDLLRGAIAGLRAARRPLIWLESADVKTTRAAIQLAETVEATLLVAQSPGAATVHAVTSQEGSLGSSLSELNRTATLVVHIGRQHLLELPMLSSRFIDPAVGQIFLERSHGQSGGDHSRPAAQSMIELGWPRHQWLDRLTRTLLILGDDSTAVHRPAEEADREAAHLAQQLLASRYTVFLALEDEFSEVADRLILERILEICRFASQTTRCTLLLLAEDAGRVAASHAALWLTNLSGPVRFRSGQWQAVESSAGMSLHEWRDAHDWIVCVRTLPSDRPLPALSFDLVMDALCNGPPPTGGNSHRQIYLPVQSVGIDSPGHLSRADHVLDAHAPAIRQSSTGMVSAAQQLLRLSSAAAQVQEST